MSEALPLLEVLAPLGLEARALRRGLPQHTRVVKTGVGPRRSRRAARRLVRSPARALAVAGVCGALDRNLVPGDVVVASTLQGEDGPAFDCESSQALCQALAELGISAQRSPVFSSDHLVRGSERQRLAARGARAVDMESRWLAEGAAGRPLAVLRVVVDAPGNELIRPGALLRGWRALGTLRRAAPALEAWAERVAQTDHEPEED